MLCLLLSTPKHRDHLRINPMADQTQYAGSLQAKQQAILKKTVDHCSPSKASEIELLHLLRGLHFVENLTADQVDENRVTSARQQCIAAKIR